MVLKPKIYKLSKINVLSIDYYPIRKSILLPMIINILLSIHMLMLIWMTIISSERVKVVSFSTVVNQKVYSIQSPLETPKLQP
jgi:hypothetical protein